MSYFYCDSICGLSIFPKTRIKLLLDDMEVISGPARSNYNSLAETSSQGFSCRAWRQKHQVLILALI